VALGSILKQILGQFGIVIGGYVRSISEVKATLEDNVDLKELEGRIKKAEISPMSCPDEKAEKAMGEAIESAAKKGETLGGIFEIVALNVPPGLGSYAQGNRRIEARLAAAVMSIQAVKGVEIGPAFENASMMGRAVQDEIFLDDTGRLARTTNRAGGIEGGITTSEPVVVRAAMKPIATTLSPTKSVDLATMEPRDIKYERSDICPVPRAVVVGEAAVTIIIADALFEKLGGDSYKEMLPRFEKLNSGLKDEFDLDNKPWRFGYRV
jgi:chorismate synthase